jgi:hypothetical protein
LQYGFGQRKGLERSEETGRERVVLARGMDVGEGAVEDEAEEEAEAWEGNVTRELDGVLAAGVVELELYGNVGGTWL